MTLKKYLWPVVGAATIAVCGWLLYKELRGLSLDDVWDSLMAISAMHWLLAGASTLVAYAALAVSAASVFCSLRARAVLRYWPV